MPVCEICRTEVDLLSEPGIVYAVELELVQAPHGIEQFEGRGVFFHVTCYPEDSEQWRRKPIPAGAYQDAG